MHRTITQDFLGLSQYSYQVPNPKKLEKKKILYHEITKVRNHEKDHENFRGFQISCFRDYFYFFVTKYTNFTVKGPST
jgi:hypothetical protein